MRSTFRNMLMLTSLAVAAALPACDNPSQAQRYPVAETTNRYQIKVEDFDLETLSGLLRTKRVTNATDLEQAANTGAINNVDIDRDGNIDRIGVRESQNGQGRTFEFVAFPSGESNPQPVTVASIGFNIVGDQIRMNAGYPDYVAGYNNAFYTYAVPRGPSLGELMFYTWLFAPSRPVYVYRPYVPASYVARPVYAPATLRTVRTTYRAETRVAPVPVSAPPPSYKVPYAPQTASRFATKAPAPASNRLSDRAGQMSDFRVRDASKPKTTGVAFGAAPSPAPAKSSWSIFGNGSPSPSPSNSGSRSSSIFGGGSASRPSAPSAPSRSSGSIFGSGSASRPSAPSAPSRSSSSPSFGSGSSRRR